MNKQAFYLEFLSKFIKRFAIFGLPGAVLFLVFWYLMGGYAFWGRLLDICAMPLSFVLDLSYEAGTLQRAALVSAVSVYDRSLEVVYYVNQLNSNLVVLVLIFCTWPHKSWKDALKLLPFLFVFMIGLQLFSVWVQGYEGAMGPKMADRLKVYWEPSAWYEVIRHIAAFDKFILRYYGAFPVFGMALVCRYFLEQRKSKKVKAQK